MTMDRRRFLGTSVLAGLAAQAFAAPITEKPGDTIGRYKLLQQIGEGGYSETMLAYHKITGEKFAIKMLRASTATQNLKERFATEIDIHTRSKDCA